MKLTNHPGYSISLFETSLSQPDGGLSHSAQLLPHSLDELGKCEILAAVC
jgi:hypothetical protein